LVHIKRIEISGFKTFKNKTTVPLNRGLTIITGPNGSGKSNIFDAVKFALGELSAKKMRGESLSALVHKGIQSSSSSAFVSVEFDNRNRKIPLDSDTVTISREFRNEGEGIYRLNDQRASRKQLTILLASADIELLIYNFVGQNALTRLAEQNATDRREMLEDFLGLGVYDEKKAALGTQFQLIEVNAKVESARIEEVQSRVESLERERNTYLRSRQLENEINQLQTQIISRKINHARLELGEMEGTISKHQETPQNLQMQQDKLTEQKDTLEKEIWATQDAAYEDAKNRLETIQQTMIELTTNIATNRAAKNISEMNMKLLEDRKASLQKTLDQNLASIDETKKELPTLLTTKLEELQRTINHTEKSIEECSTQLEERTPEAKANQEDEHAIKVLTERVSKAQVHKKTCSIQIENLKEKLQTLQAQKGETENLIQTYTQRIQELHTAKEEQAWIQETKSKIDEIINVKSKYEKELEQAIDIENRCLTALVEIETQRRLVNLRPEEAALQAIQQKVAEGKISGVYGTLGSQVRPKNGCARAVEAAAAGWMKALIVKDFQTVVSCIEILKTLKIGRIKLIPLELLTRGVPQRLPDKITGIIGPITEQLIYEESLKPTVECVFGNTVLASNQKSAFLASLNNVRAVAESGDLYEPDGAMEAGHFRQSPDMISQTADQMIGQLKTIFTNFQEVTRKARDNIARLEKETKHLNSSRSQSESYIRRIERDLYNFEEHLTHVRERREEIDRLAVCTTRELATEQAVLVACQFKHDKLQTELEHALEAYNAQNRSSHDRFFAEISDQRSKLTDELNKLSLTRTEIEQRIKFLTSTMTSLQEAAVSNNCDVQ
jgi:chromosome segregation protein